MRPTKEVLASEHKHEEWHPILEMAAREVFQLMLASELKTAPPPEAPDQGLDVTSMVGLAGKLCGLLSIRCTGKTAALIASKMLGVDVEKASAELNDALGEVANMVAGNFKNKISGLNDGCMLSVPTVVIGTDYILHSMADSPGIEIRLLFEDKPILVSIQINE